MPGGEVEAEAARALLLELTGQAGVAPPAPTHWRLFALLVASPGPLSLRRPSLPPCWSPARLLPLVLQLQPPSRRRVVQRAPRSDKLTVGQRNDDTGLLDSFATAAAEERTGRSCLGSTAACRSRSCLGLVLSLDCSDGCVAMCAFLCIANRIGTSRRRGAAAGRGPSRRVPSQRRGAAAGRATRPWPGGQAGAANGGSPSRLGGRPSDVAMAGRAYPARPLAAAPAPLPHGCLLGWGRRRRGAAWSLRSLAAARCRRTPTRSPRERERLKLI